MRGRRAPVPRPPVGCGVPEETGPAGPWCRSRPRECGRRGWGGDDDDHTHTLSLGGSAFSPGGQLPGVWGSVLLPAPRRLWTRRAPVVPWCGIPRGHLPQGGRGWAAGGWGMPVVPSAPRIHRREPGHRLSPAALPEAAGLPRPGPGAGAAADPSRIFPKPSSRRPPPSPRCLKLLHARAPGGRGAWGVSGDLRAAVTALNGEGTATRS